MRLHREVGTVPTRMTLRQVLLALVGCAALLAGSQQCASDVRTRLDASVKAWPMPRTGFAAVRSKERVR